MRQDKEVVLEVTTGLVANQISMHARLAVVLLVVFRLPEGGKK